MKIFQVGAVIVYTFVFHMLAPPALEEAHSSEKSPVVIKIEGRDKTMPLSRMTYDGDYADSELQVPLLRPRPAPSKLAQVLKSFSSHEIES